MRIIKYFQYCGKMKIEDIYNWCFNLKNMKSNYIFVKDYKFSNPIYSAM